MPHRVRKLLLDLSLACAETIQFCAGKDLANFQSDRVLQLAVERQFEIIGEALLRLERIDADNLAQRIPEYRKIFSDLETSSLTAMTSSMMPPQGLCR
jgi:uncharacterized protein with HEPN domain